MNDDDFFWEGLRNDRLLFQECTSCRQLRHPAGPMCPQCQSLQWAPVTAGGRGVVRAWLESKHPSLESKHLTLESKHLTWPDANPRIVALIELTEGLRLISNLRDIALADIREGLPVSVFFDDINGQRLHQFRPEV